jgi:hypothetical protein
MHDDEHVYLGHNLLECLKNDKSITVFQYFEIPQHFKTFPHEPSHLYIKLHNFCVKLLKHSNRKVMIIFYPLCDQIYRKL